MIRIFSIFFHEAFYAYLIYFYAYKLISITSWSFMVFRESLGLIKDYFFLNDDVSSYMQLGIPII